MTASSPVANRAPLYETPFIPLPLGSVRAGGWLANQLKLQAEGMTGHAEAILPLLGPDSAWRGGTGEDWEKGPYYLRGLISLAFLHDDAGLRQKVQSWVDALLAGQQPNGQIGPASNLDWWPRMVICWALRDYHEATGDERIIPALLRYARYLGDTVDSQPLHNWARARVADQIDTLFWLYNRTGESFLLELADRLPAQGNGWLEFFNTLEVKDSDFAPSHAVNVSQAMKYPVVLYQRSGETSHRDAFGIGYEKLREQHGLAFGMWSGTEALVGHADTQGVELCSMAEQILSNAMALKVLADPEIGDEQERIAFNLLAAATTKDFKQHQYYSLPNMPIARINPRGLMPFRDDHGDDLLVSPHSGFHCCCYNLHMGWPKYVQYAWMATAEGGLAAVAHGPTTVSTKIGGVAVSITQQTDYPFEDTTRFSVEAARPVAFPLLLRIPGWSKSTRARLNGEPIDGVVAGSFLRIEREWQSGDTVTLSFEAPVRVETGHSGSASVWRGPLVFSLRIEERKTVLKALPDGFDEMEFSARSPWNFGLDRDANGGAIDLSIQRSPMPINPWLPETAPLSLTLSGVPLPQWTLALDDHIAGETPQSPISTTAPSQPIRLVPCGAQTLRITAFPWRGGAG